MTPRYKNFEMVKIGDKIIFDNTLGIIENIEKTKLLGTIIEKLEDDNVKVNVESVLFSKPVETIIKYYVLV